MEVIPPNSHVAGCGGSGSVVAPPASSYHTNQYANPPETPLNIEEHFMSENRLR
jgi:hypothetical protein